MIDKIKRPAAVHGSTTRIRLQCGNLYVTINRHEGKMFEVFAQMGRSGGCTSCCNYPELRRLAPYYADGKPIKNIPADEYRVAYEMSVLLQDTATAELASVVGSMKADETMAMLCWCNLSRQKAHQKLMCHRILVGYWIEEHAPDVVVVYRDGAENPVWERR